MANQSLAEIEKLLNEFESLRGLQLDKRRSVLEKVRELLSSFKGDELICSRDDLDIRDKSWFRDLDIRQTTLNGLLECNPDSFRGPADVEDITSREETEKEVKVGDIELSVSKLVSRGDYFPYIQLHPGQEMGINKITLSAKDGRALLLNSPTGTGKTIMVLSGLLKAVKKGEKIVILTRTHSQYNSFLREVRNIIEDGDAVECGFLLGREKACPINVPRNICASAKIKARKNLENGLAERCNGDLLNLRGKKIQEKSTGFGCPYLINTYRYDPNQSFKLREDVLELVKKFRKKPSEVGEFIEWCENMDFPPCPYEVMRRTLIGADVLVLQYQYFIDSGIRDHMYGGGLIDCKPAETHLVIDEAHNIGNIIVEQDNPECTLDEVHAAIKFLKNTAKEPDYDLKSLKEEIDVSIILLEGTLSSVLNWFNENEHAFQQTNDAKEGDIIFKLEKAGNMRFSYGEEEVFHLKENEVKCIEKVGKSVSAQFKKILGGEDIPEFSDSPDICRVAELIGAFNRLTEKRYIHCLHYKTREKETLSGIGIDEFDVRLKIIEVDPRDKIRELFKNSKSLVLMSGTLTPVNLFSKLLFYSDIPVDELDIPNPFPRENRIVASLTDVTSAYGMRLDEDNRRALQSAIQAMAMIEGNVAIFFPSYGVIGSYKSFCEEVCKTQGKKIFIEEQGRNKNELLTRFKGSENAMLVGVCRGSLSEGVDYPDEEMKSVAVIGIPFAKPSKIQGRIEEYYEDIGLDGRELTYNLPGIIASTQAIGRCIRSMKDRGLLILGDYRYEYHQYKKLLPKWIQEELKPAKSDEISELTNFVKQRE